MTSKKLRKERVELANHFQQKSTPDHDTIVKYEHPSSPSERKNLDYLLDNNIITRPHQSIARDNYITTHRTIPFIENKGYTEEELREKRQNRLIRITIYISLLVLIITLLDFFSCN